MMEAEPAPDLSMMLLRELLAPSCLDPEPLPGPPAQQAPRTPRCLRPSSRCVKEPPLLPNGPSGQGVMTLVRFPGLFRSHRVSYWYLQGRGSDPQGYVGSRVARGHAVALAEACVGLPRKGGDHAAPCPQFLLACTSGLRHQPAPPPRDRGGAGGAPCPGHPGPGPLLGAEGPGGFGSSAPGRGSQGHADPNWSARRQPGASRDFRSPSSPTSEAPEAANPAPGRRESGPSVRGSDPEVSDKAGLQPSDHPQLQVGTGGG